MSLSSFSWELSVSGWSNIDRTTSPSGGGTRLYFREPTTDAPVTGFVLWSVSLGSFPPGCWWSSTILRSENRFCPIAS